MPNASPKTIVFISGIFIGNNCWDNWKEYFNRNGYESIAPCWPCKDASPEELRNRASDDGIALNRLNELTAFFEDIIHKLPAKPILIGHSLGGLVVQLLLQKGLGSAGVAVHSFPPARMNMYHFSLFRKVWPMMALFSSPGKNRLITYTRWQHTIANGMTGDTQKELYYKYATPESKLLIKDAFTCAAKINFKHPHAPLLLTAGDFDRIIPEKLVYNTYKKYAIGDSVTNYKNFHQHNHLVFDSPAWEKEAAFILYWLKGLSIYQ